MAGKGNPMPGPHLNGFPMPTYYSFFPHMLGSMSPPALSGLPISGYSTPSPATTGGGEEEYLLSFVCVLVYLCGCGTMFPVAPPPCVCVCTYVFAFESAVFPPLTFILHSFSELSGSSASASFSKPQ
eukprot:superscaffoldBa00004490_g18965